MRLSVLNATELKHFASDRGINLPARLRKKEEILAFIEDTLSDPEFEEKLKQKREFQKLQR